MVELDLRWSNNRKYRNYYYEIVIQLLFLISGFEMIC